MRFLQIFRLLQICGSITCTWPHDPDARKLIYVLREIMWCFTILIVFSIQLLMLYSVYKKWHDIVTMMEIVSQFGALTELLFNIIICRLKSARMQCLLMELRDFHHTSSDHERIILQKYMDRYYKFFVVVVVNFIAAIITFSCGPIFLSRKFPIDAWYPFPTDSSIVICVVYILEVYVIIQTGLGICVDFIFAMLFLYSSARLEILYSEIRNAKNREQIKSCIRKHQEIIEFVNETNRTVQHALFKTNIIMASTAICGTFPIIRKSFWITSQFICMTVAAYQRLYITAWPADDLMENSGKRLTMEIHNISWIGKSQSTAKDVCFMIQRSQEPLVIKMGSLLPALSLQYYAKYLITVFSYFMTMRAIFGD